MPVLALLVAVLGGSGCVTLPGIRDERTAQTAILGPVRVTTTLCPFVLSGGPTGAPLPTSPPGTGVPGACANTFQDVLTSTPAHSLPGQILVAYRIPAGATAPETLSTAVDVRPSALLTGRGANPVERRTVTFTRSSALAVATEDWYEAPAQTGGGDDALPAGLDRELVHLGERLVAYISDVLPGPIVSDMELAPEFGLPPVPGGPFAGPFRHLTLTGWRLALPQPLPGRWAVPGTASPTRAPSCRTTPSALRVVADLKAGSAAPGDLTVCPVPVGPRPASSGGTSMTALLAGTTTPTRDLVVVGGAAAAEQGSLVGVPFTVRGSGPDHAGAPVGLRAFGGVPGSTPAPRQGSVSFPAGRADLREVVVGVPPATPPGTYDVGLRAVVAGQERAGVAKLTVVPRRQPYTLINPPLVGQPQVVVSIGAAPGEDAVASSRPSLERLALTSTGTVPFGYICRTTAAACASSQATLLVTEGALGLSPPDGQLPRMLRIAQRRFKAVPLTRTRPKLLLSPFARITVDSGQPLRALLVIRPADESPPQVRRVQIVDRR